MAGLFLISSDQEFTLHLDTSEGEEDESGSDDEAGVAGTPGKITLIVFSVPPCAVPGSGPGQAASAATPREYIFFSFLKE